MSSFPGPGSFPGSHIAFGFHVFFLSITLICDSSSVFLFHDFDIVEHNWSFICVSLNLDLSDILAWFDWGMLFWLKDHWSHAMFFSVHLVRKYCTWYQHVLVPVMLVLTTFFKVLSARFLFCKVTIFPFVSNACLVGRHLEMMHIFGLSLYFWLPVLAPIDAVCLQ